MSKLFQTIDKRIAKFSTQKDLKLKQNSSIKDLRNVKLDPLSQIKNLNIESISVPSSNQNLNSRKKIKDQRSRKSIEMPKKLKNRTEILCFKNIAHSIEEIPVFESISLPVELNNTVFEKKELKNNLLERFKTLSIKLKTHKKPSILNNYHWILYKKWKSVLEKGIKRLMLKWKLKKTAENILKSWLQSTILQRAYKSRVISAIKIQKYWTQVYKTRKYFLSAKALATILAPFAKKNFKKKSKSATLIQKNFRRFIVQKRFQPILLQKASVRKHKTMLERQASLVKNRNIKKSAVKVIERFWLNIKEKQKIREMRKYLLTLPYECRQLYIKFKQVKQDADNLKNDVDAMIAKKREKIQAK